MHTHKQRCEYAGGICRYCGADEPERDELDICTACLRQSLECSRNPCASVIADRNAVDPIDTPAKPNAYYDANGELQQ